MYTVKILGKSINKAARRKTVTVQFASADNTFDKDFHYNLETEWSFIQQDLKRFVKELEAAEASVEDIAEGVIDLNAVPAPAPAGTADDAQWNVWLEDYLILQQLKALVTDGIVPVANPRIAELKELLKTNFKPAYAKKLAAFFDR